MSELYLIHHGIAGQKWGVENGPPYPLSPQDHSAREKRLAAKTLNKADKDLSIKEHKAKISAGNVNRLQNKYDKISDKKSNKAIKLKDKLKATNKQADSDIKEFRKSEKEVKALVKDYLKQGYTIESKRCIRDVRTGKQKASEILLTVGSMGITVAMAYVGGTGAASVGLGTAMGAKSYAMVNRSFNSEQGVKYRVR